MSVHVGKRERVEDIESWNHKRRRLLQETPTTKRKRLDDQLDRVTCKRRKGREIPITGCTYEEMKSLLMEVEEHYSAQLQEQRRIFSAFIYENIVLPNDNDMSYIS
jgi:hypothetical protein